MKVQINIRRLNKKERNEKNTWQINCADQPQHSDD